MELLFSKNHITCSLIPYAGDKTDIHEISGLFKLKSPVLFHYEVYTQYCINFDLHNSLLIGVGVRTVKHGYAFFSSQNNFTPRPVNGEDFSTRIISGLRTYALPFLYEQRTNFSAYKYLALDAGISFRYNAESNTQLVLSESSGNYEIINVALKNGKNFWLNYNAAFNFCWLLKNNQILKTGVAINYAPESFYYGDYKITIPGQERSTGTYGVKGSYIGFNISYVFTGSGKNKQ